MNAEYALIVFFKLLNFAVLVGIFLYVWHRYVKDRVISEFEKARAYLASLSREVVLLQRETKKLAKKYNQDELERDALKERLHLWQAAIQAEQHELSKRKAEQLRQLEITTQEQLQRVHQYRLYCAVQKEAIEQLRTQLQEQYSAPEDQEKVITNIVNRLDAA